MSDIHSCCGNDPQCSGDGCQCHQLAKELAAVTAEREELRAELERERLRLAACGVVAMANTPETAAKAREMHADYRSASCDDVARAVDYQMRLRTELESALRAVPAPEQPEPDTRREFSNKSPSAVYRPRLLFDGNQWCALYGDNLRDGVAGFGDSPAAAMRHFDYEWSKKLGAGL